MQTKLVEKQGQYPYLKKNLLSSPNSQIIIEALEQHFRYLFNLDVLEQNVAQSSKEQLENNNYYQCFEHCIKHLSWFSDPKPFTVPEVVEALSTYLNHYNFHDVLGNNLIFVGDGKELQGTQLSYVEKIIAKQAKPAEGLTFVDMLRFIECFKEKPNVFQLTHLLLYRDLTTVFSPGNNLLINLNHDTAGEPKWAAIHVAKEGLQIYCEAMLLESEKQQLAGLAQKANLTIQKYEGQTAENSISCGYMAVAWLKEAIKIPTKNQWIKALERENSGQNLAHSSLFWSLRNVFIRQSMKIGNSNEREPKYYLNSSSYHNYSSLGFIVRSSSNSYALDLNDIDTLSVLFKRDIINTADTVKKIKSNKSSKKKNEKEKVSKLKELANHLLQVDTFQKNQANLIAHKCLIQEDNRVFFKIPHEEQIDSFIEKWIFYGDDKEESYLNSLTPDYLENLKPENNLQALKILKELQAQIAISRKERKDYCPRFQSTNQEVKAFNVFLNSLSENETKNNKKIIEDIKHHLKKNTPNKPTPNTLLLAIFNDAAARCKVFEVEAYKGFALTQEEQKYLADEMLYNPFMQVFKLHGEDHDPSLLEFQARISPVLARNRWLAENNYKPPAMADYWQVAARYWLRYLYHHSYVLAENPHHQPFKTAVAEMGNTGLSHLLTYLTEQETSIKAMLGEITPPFYLGLCDEESYQKLITHLKENRYFPFGQIGLGYTKNRENDLCVLFNLFNSTPTYSLEKIELRNVPSDGESLFASLQKEAIANHWTIPIVIPNLPSQHPDYVQLNNIILSNRREKLGREHKEIVEKALSKADNTSTQAPTVEPAVFVKPKFNLSFGPDAPALWPLHRQQGGAKLQIQYQQQMQHQQQLQQQAQPFANQSSQAELALVGELVDAENVERLLNHYYQSLLQEFPNSTLDLKKFFQQIIQAKPDTKAPHLIQYLTQDAAKYLLRQAMKQKPAGGQLTSGLNTQQHLPKGLLTQRTQKGNLVLCYDAERNEEQILNPCRLDLDFVAPAAVVWQGDYRQFSLKNNQEKDPAVLKDAFAALQPGNISNSKVSANQALALLMPTLSQSLQELQLSENAARALGQLYYQLDEVNVSLLIKEILLLKQVFPRQFEQFKAAFLDPCQNMTILCQAPTFQTLRAISSQLSQPANATQAAFWWRLSELHAKAVGFERPEVLWRAFQYFVTELQKEGVELINLETLKHLSPMNALVWMDHVLTCVHLIPTQNQKQRFIDNLHKYDLTPTGLPYALQYEGFKRISSDIDLNLDLKLAKFESGQPTYAPDIASIFEWKEKEFDLQVKRLLATQSGLTDLAYHALCQQFTQPPLEMARAQLLCWLLTTPLEFNHQTVIQNVKQLDKSFLMQVAKTLHQAICINKQPKPAISLAALAAIQKNQQSTALNTLFSFLGIEKQLDFAWLEAANILYERNALNELDKISALHKKYPCPEGYPLSLYTAAFKLAAVFGQYDVPKEYLEIYSGGVIPYFIRITQNMRPAAKEAVDLLLQQIFSIDHQNTQKKFDFNDWASCVATIRSINDRLYEAHNTRLKYSEQLKNQGVAFRYQMTGDLRTLKETDRQAVNLSLFVDHENRLWEFLQQHIAIPIGLSPDKSLQPLLDLLKELQLKRGHVNEIEQLLLVLTEATADKKNHYWEANYFCQLLQSLKPKDTHAAYPISLLKTLLFEPSLAAKPIGGLIANFPESLANKIAQISANEKFTQQQQAQLYQLAIREFAENNAYSFVDILLQSLADQQIPVCDYVLERLVSCQSVNEAKQLWNTYQSLLIDLKTADKKIPQQWPSICHDWLVAIDRNSSEKSLFLSIKNLPDEQKQIQLLTLIALSTLRPGLKSKAVQADELNRKAPKLIERLQQLDSDSLNRLINYYEEISQPVPSAEDLLQIIKSSESNTAFGRKLDDKQLTLAFENFERNPQATLPNDYGVIAVTRDPDFHRLLNETSIQLPGEEKRQLNDKERDNIRNAFTLLKQLESGEIKVEVDAREVQIKRMTRKQLINHFKRLSYQGNTTKNNIIKLALSFEAIKRSSGKYPYLAQQFAIVLTNLFPSQAQVAVLDTGEGKSHFNALCAAQYVMQGKQVYIPTANSSLAERDYQAYQQFFHYLGINSAYLNANSPDDCLSKNQIIYATVGERALYEAKQAYLGNPVAINKEKWVGILDEIDFIYFEEGLKVEYNFSIPQNKTTEQMRWFYHTLNQFVQENYRTLQEQQGISRSLLEKLVNQLIHAAGDNTSRQHYLADLVGNPIELVRFVQSAYAANFSLAADTDGGFCVPKPKKDELTEIAGKKYLIQKAIPLSSDNQKAVDSIFNDGIQQFLTEKLVNEAIQNNQPQNFYAPPLSDIVSSQIAETCLSRWCSTWIGATGSLSQQQADILGCTALYIPTNQPCRRVWKKPIFFNDENSYLDAIAEETKNYLKENKSILFGCKNDNSVKNLHEKLTSRLTPEEYHQLILFTNDSGETTSAALARKEALEHQGSITQQQGIGFFASSVGRGDNVGVKAVFVVDPPRDKNTLTQLGGRTARGGEDGDVLSFYLWPKIQAEYDTICKIMEQQDNAFLQQIKLSITANPDHEQNEQREQIFNALLELKEHLALLNSADEHQYQIAKDEYTYWGTSVLSTLAKEPEKRATIEKLWTRHLRQIDNAWLAISNAPGKTTAQKAQEIREYILTENTKYVKALPIDLITPFSFTTQANIKSPKNLLDNRSRETSAKRDLSAIILSLTATYIKQENPQTIQQLLENAAKAVPDSQLWTWLNHYEKLALALPPDNKETLLIAIAKVMQQCDSHDPASIEAFDQLLTKTLQWWDKGQGKYQTTLFKLWDDLSKNQNHIPLKELIKLFSLKEPGKLGFTWLARYSQLSPDLSQNNWLLLQTIVPYLDQLPGKKANKIHLFDKIIEQIAENPDKKLTAELIKAVITSLLPEKILANVTSPQHDRVFASKQLFLPFVLGEKISQEVSLAITQKVLAFLANTEWRASEIDDYLIQIKQLLKNHDNPLTLIDHILNFQNQCCQDNNNKEIASYLQFLNQQRDCYIFLQSDGWLNQRFTEFFHFINRFQQQPSNEITTQLADFYFNKSIEYPEYLASIYTITFDLVAHNIQSMNAYHRNIQMLNRLGNPALHVITEHFSNIKLDQQAAWLLADLQKLPDNAEEKTTLNYLAALNLFYSQLGQLPEDIREKNRKNFQALTFDQTNQLLHFLTKNPAIPPQLILFLFAFFDSNNNEEDAKKAFPLAQLFYFIGIQIIKSSENVEEQELTKITTRLNLLKHFFSAEKLQKIQEILNNTNKNEADFIIPTLVKLPLESDVSSFINTLRRFYKIVSDKITLEKCSNLNTSQLTGFLDFFNKNNLTNKHQISSILEIFSKYPATIAEIFIYAAEGFFDEESNKTLLYVLTQKYNYQWKGKNENEILALIRENRAYLIQLLTDGFLFGYQHLSINKKADYLTVVKKFYTAMKDNTIENLVSPFFDFNQPSQKNERIIFMHLLQQGAFISLIPSLNGWTAEENHALLQKCLNSYKAQAQSIIGTSTNLTNEQQAELLVLADELKAASRTWNKDKAFETAITQQNPKILEPSHDDVMIELSDETRVTQPFTSIVNAVAPLIETYRQADKSEARERLLSNFEMNLKKSSSPLNILEWIYEAREAAIQSDQANPGWIFKLHRKGYSRFFDLLTKLEDEVLRQCATEPTQSAEFAECTTYVRKNLGLEIEALLHQLNEDKYTVLSQLLSAVNASSPASVATALGQLKHDLFSNPVAPGHLKALVKPLIDRLEIYLMWQDKAKTTTYSNLAELWQMLQIELEKYATASHQSTDRKIHFEQLKNALLTATDAPDYHMALKNAIQTARMTATANDTAHRNDFFPPHFGGDSRYLTLLNKLDEQVIDSNNKLTQGENHNFQDAYLKEKLKNAETALHSALAAFYEEKKDSVLWKSRIHSVKELLDRITPKASPPEEKPESDVQSNSISLIQELQDKKALLPGYLQVLVNDLLTTFDEINKYSPIDKLDRN